MPLKKSKPDPRFAGTKATVAVARGTRVKSKEQVNAQRAPSEWDKRIAANKAKLAATPDFKADTTSEFITLNSLNDDIWIILTPIQLKIKKRIYDI